MKLDDILDLTEVKMTTMKVSKDNLVKWNWITNKDATYMSKEDISQLGVIFVDLISSRSIKFSPLRVYGARAPTCIFGSISGFMS
jgi:hypothetical protein